TGLVGGAIPTKDGIVISLERLNKILEIDTENMMAVVEAGVPFSVLNVEAEKYGLWFPPHPGEESAQIGGVTACNAGGVRCIRYGVLRDYVKGLEVVLPTGKILTLGGKVYKDVSGYSLLHLLIGSGGTLGIITKVIVRLYPKPKTLASIVVAYANRHKAIETVPAILKEDITPLAIEYMERDFVERSAKRIGKRWPMSSGDFFLYMIITGDSEKDAYITADTIYKICEKYDPVDGLIETNIPKQEDLLAIRSNLYTVIKDAAIDLLDITLPRASMAKFLDKLEDIGKKYNARIPFLGHAGDGNLHVFILDENSAGPRKEDREKMLEEIYCLNKELGGVVSGEHGLGKTHTKIFAKLVDKEQIELMKKIKKVFDPNDILNPGCIIPE
ncbi:MAG: FAD-binding oxidoreductase, partial [Candidatus Bathyarchaeia archaeon]